ncbi:DUF2188 domain-containing protein [Cytobacillus suaedae]|nr:DUF2188 domain-containing protein [Cytobacillus suaedae]
MSWNIKDYPDSMKNLDEVVREEAISIANGLLDEGYEAGRAIAIAVARAKETYGDEDPIHHVVPHPDGWAIKKEKTQRASGIFDTKKEALKKAQQMASKEHTRLIIHRQDGKIEKHQNYK